MADIIRVYSNESDALAGGTDGLIVDSDVGTSEGVVQNASGDGSGTDNDDIPYFIYNRYYYRIDANEPVSEFHIDWDDGENNSPEKRNIQIIKLKTPKTFCVVEHVYTKVGPFYPLIRVKSMDGFLSKFYTSDNPSNSFTELEPTTVSAGQNGFSKVSKTKANAGQIATFIPSITPPVAILKTDKKRIFSGIDNKHITGTYPLLYCVSSMTSGTQPIVKLTVQGATGVVREYTLPASSIATANTDLDEDTGTSGDIYDKYVPFGNEGDKEVSTITCVSDDEPSYESTSSGSGRFINLYNPDGNRFIITFETAGGTGYTDPSQVSGATAHLKINSPAIIAGDDKEGVATNLKAQIEGDSTFAAQFTVTVSGAVVTVTNKANGNPTNIETGFNSGILTVATSTAGSVTKTDSASRLLRAELLNMTKLGDSDRIFVKVHDVGSDISSVADTDGDRAVCVLSNGNPIVDLSDPVHNFTVDASESFSRASNSSISNYYLDTDSLMHSAIQSASSLSNKVGNCTDVLNTSNWAMPSTGTIKQKTLSYTNDNIGHYLDANGRFNDFYRLLRLQVLDNHSKAVVLEASGEMDNRASIIEHYDDDQYVSTVNSGANRIPANLQSRGLILYSNSDTDITTEMSAGSWKDLTATSRTNALMIGSNAASGLAVVSSGGGSNTNKFQTGSLTAGTANAPNSTQRPDNYLLICKTDKYDRVYFRTDSSFASTDAEHNMKITAWYPTAAGWRPLEITDKTLGLKTSGYISFRKPNDWESMAFNGIEGGNWTGPVHDDDDSTGTAAPRDLWDFSAFSILIGFMPYADSGDADKVHVHNIWPFSNQHSQLIRIVDPHHASLNDIAISQSISFRRSGKFQNITDRFGKSEIRKMGANGGKVSFGGVDLGDADNKGNRKKMKEFQQNATPVFLDVEHRSGEKTRFFGVITDMTEDHPVGTQFPKFAVTLQVSHLIEMESDGDILSDKISIGGKIDDKRQFVSTA